MRAANGTGNFSKWLLQFGIGEFDELIVENSSAFHCTDLTDWFFEDVSHATTDLVS